MVGVAGCGVDGNGGIVHINRAVDGWWIYMIVPPSYCIKKNKRKDYPSLLHALVELRSTSFGRAVEGESIGYKG